MWVNNDGFYRLYCDIETISFLYDYDNKNIGFFDISKRNNENQLRVFGRHHF